MKTRIAYIGLGSNLDQPYQQIKKAIIALNNLAGTKVKTDSGYFKSRPMGPADQPDYVNAVVELETVLGAVIGRGLDEPGLNQYNETVMPANLTPEYKNAEKEYRAASTPQEKLAGLEKMLATIPKPQGTEHMQGDPKRKITRKTIKMTAHSL